MVAWLRQEASLRTRLMLGFSSVSILAGAGLIPLAQLRSGLGDATAASGSDLTWALTCGVAAVAGSFVLGCVWAATTATPIGQALQRLEEVAAGRLDGAAVHSAGAGLVGRLGRATEKLRGLAREHLRTEGERTECRAELAAEQDRHAQTRSAWQTQERQVIETLSACLARLRAGDLAARLTAALPPEYGAVREAFNDVFALLQTALTTVAERVGTLLAGAGEMSATAAEMARRTEQQAVILRQTTTALSQITETVRRSSAVAEEANTVVSVARGDAEKSGAVMAQAVSAMTHIEQSAGQISQIIGVIDEIAFQTNLLALNAGVEAARAGEAGRGFAVVASEVRALAQRSAEAAKQIKTLITTSTQQVKSGVGLVGQAGEALHRIVTQVATLDKLIAGMTASAKEQASGLVEVNAAVNQMDQATQQSAAMVQSSTASGAALAREASALADQVGGFRLRSDKRPASGRLAAPSRGADAPARGKLSPPARSAAGHSAPKQPAPKQPAHATTDPDDWSEF